MLCSTTVAICTEVVKIWNAVRHLKSAFAHKLADLVAFYYILVYGTLTFRMVYYSLRRADTR